MRPTDASLVDSLGQVFDFALEGKDQVGVKVALSLLQPSAQLAISPVDLRVRSRMVLEMVQRIGWDPQLLLSANNHRLWWGVVKLCGQFTAIVSGDSEDDQVADVESRTLVEIVKLLPVLVGDDRVDVELSRLALESGKTFGGEALVLVHNQVERPSILRWGLRP